MVTTRNKSGSFFFLAFVFLAITSLKGCAIPVLMAADGIQHYAGKVTLTGAEIVRMADWNNRYNKEVNFALPGVSRGEYTCARQSGTELCVVSEQATRSNISPKTTFECHLGRGGPFTNLITNDSSTLYCRRIA